MSAILNIVLALQLLPSEAQTQVALPPARIPGIVAKALEVARADSAVTHGIASGFRVATDPEDAILRLLAATSTTSAPPRMTAALSEGLMAVPTGNYFRCANAVRSSSSCKMTRDGHFLSVRRATMGPNGTELTIWVSRSSLRQGHFEGVTVELIFVRNADGSWQFLRKSPIYRFSS